MTGARSRMRCREWESIENIGMVTFLRFENVNCLVVPDGAISKTSALKHSTYGRRFGGGEWG